jgi:hypothetical protein
MNKGPESTVNGVLVLIVVTSALGPILTDEFAKRMAAERERVVLAAEALGSVKA